MTDPIEINRGNWHEPAMLHKGAPLFVMRHGYPTSEWASAMAIVDPMPSQYQRDTAVADATQ